MGFLRLGGRGVIRSNLTTGGSPPPPTTTQGWANPNGDGTGTVTILVLGGGSTADTDTGTGMGLARGDSVPHPTYGWGDGRGWERPGDATGFCPYATLAQLPDSGTNFLSFRAISPTYAAGFWIPSGTAQIAIEYKDNFWSPTGDTRYPKSDGITVTIGGVNATTRLETLRDHKWKRIVISVPGAAVLESGRYYCKLANGEYSVNEFAGSGLFHRIIASTGTIPARPSVDGFWPNVSVTTGYANGDLRDRSGNIYVPMLGNHGGSTETNQIQQVVQMGLNTAQASASVAGSGNRTWSSNVVNFTSGGVAQTQRGMPDELAFIESFGLKAFPYDENMADMSWFQYQVGWGNPPYREDGTWRGNVAVFKAALQNYFATHTSIPFVYLKDEWDHDDQTAWGSLEEMVVELRYWARFYCPTIPTAVTNMGWKPSQLMRSSFDIADFAMVDRYATSLITSEYQAVAAIQEEMRRWAGTRAWIGVHALVLDDGTVYSGTQIQPLVYMSICAGARGFWLFGNAYNASSPNFATHCAGVKAKITDEIGSLTNVIHATATDLGRTTATLADNVYPSTHSTTGTGVTTNVNISSIYRQAPSAGRKVLMAVNCNMTAQTGVVFTVSGLTVGQVITVLFESRTITVTVNGQFTDNFAGVERHVYQIP